MRLLAAGSLALLLVSFSPAADIASSASPDILLQNGHFKRLRTFAEARLKANPKDAHAYYYLAVAALAMNDAEKSQRYAEQAVALDPSVSEHHRILAEASGILAIHVSVFKQIGLARRIKKEMDQAVALDPKNADALSLQMNYYQEAPSIVGGDKTRAAQIAQDIKKLDPNRGALAEYQLAQSARDRAHAQQIIKAAAQANPKAYEVHSAYADTLIRAKQFDDLDREASLLLALDPGRAAGYSTRAVVQAQRAQWADLERTLHQAELAAPDNLAPYIVAARVLLSNKTELPRAEQYARKYLSQEPEGNTPSAASSYWTLAIIEEQLGRKSDAVRDLQTALKLKPEMEGAKKDLQRLR